MKWLYFLKIGGGHGLLGPPGYAYGSVVLKLNKHTEPLRSFPSFCRPPFLPNITENKNGLHVSDDLHQALKRLHRTQFKNHYVSL